MTAQDSDMIRHHEESRWLVGIQGTGLFDPADHGVRAVGYSSSYWRGYQCSYEVLDGALLLNQVTLGLGREDKAMAVRGEGPKLFGRVPRHYTEYGRKVKIDPRTFERTIGEETSWESAELVVDGLRERAPFSGGLLLGSDFIWELYVHMGHHPAWKFREVHELLFDAGRLIEERDRSAAVAELRERMSSQPLEPSSGAPLSEIERWIEQCFSRDYS